MRTASRKRNASFDALKGIACIAVIFMHCEYPGFFGMYVQCMTRWSVPLFFAVSGFFFRRETTQECVRKARHIGKILWISVPLYLVYTVWAQLFIGGSALLLEYTRQEITPINIVACLLLNRPLFIEGPLWFLLALVYVYMAYAVMIRLKLTKYSRQLCVALFAEHFLLGYGSYLLGCRLPTIVFRNFLFEGLPCFLIGRIVYLRSQEWNAEQMNLISKRGREILFVGLLLSLPERLLIGTDFSIHIASVAVLYGMLLWACQYRDLNSVKVLVVLGRDGSLYVYIAHGIIYRSFDFLIDFAGLAEVTAVQWLRPVNAMAWSLAVSAAACKLAAFFNQGHGGII